MEKPSGQALRFKILVVDDEEGIRYLLRALSKEAGHTVFCAASGRVDEAGDYRVLRSQSRRVRAHASLYGSLATSLGIEATIAALALAGLTAEAGVGTEPAPRTAAVAGVCGPNRVTLVSLEV